MLAAIKQVYAVYTGRCELEWSPTQTQPREEEKRTDEDDVEESW